jgi:hypothetical protein
MGQVQGVFRKVMAYARGRAGEDVAGDAVAATLRLSLFV